MSKSQESREMTYLFLTTICRNMQINEKRHMTFDEKYVEKQEIGGNDICL
jgi:hypothetical protein